jgi:CheY-like chemotaxis protein
MKNLFFQKHRKIKILVIDDEEDVCVHLKSILERTGKFTALTATSPIEGIILAQDNHPDLVLLDILMPDMDGTEVAACLQRNPSTRDILIVFVSVLAGPEEIEEYEGKIGGHPFISKPITKEELIARLEAILQEAHVPG